MRQLIIFMAILFTLSACASSSSMPWGACPLPTKRAAPLIRDRHARGAERRTLFSEQLIRGGYHPHVRIGGAIS